MEILQHGISGELYAASYADGMTLATLDDIVGPLTPAEAYQAVDEGYAEGDMADVAWAKAQPWTAISLNDLAIRAESA